MKFLIIYILILIQLILSYHANSQTYNFKNFNTEHGLPQSQVLSLFQDHNGYMWFGTNGGGAGKYNGNKFTTLNDNDGLVSNIIYSIIENKTNSILFGTDKGLSIFDGVKFENYTEKDGLKNPMIFKLLIDESTVWIGTQEGVYVLKDKKIIPFLENKTLNNSSIYTIFKDINSNLWFGTLQNGLIFYNSKNKTFKNFTKENGLMSNFVFSIDQKSNGDIVIGTQTGSNIINEKFIISNISNFESQENIAFSSILKKDETTFSFGTFSEGIIDYNFKTNKKTKKYDSSNGLTNNSIQCLYKDREQNIWIGTDGAGVYKFKNEKFTYFSKENGLPEKYINTVTEDNRGQIWIAMRSNGLCRISNNTLDYFNQNNQKKYGLTDNDVNTILPLKNGSILFGTKAGLFEFYDEQFHIISNSFFKEKYIFSLFQSTNNTIWVGTNDGLYRIENGIITEEIIINKFRQENIQLPIYSIIEDKFQSIWLASDHGVIKIDKEGNSIQYDKTNKFTNSRVLSMVIDNTKNLWFGTEEGLFNYNNKDITKISQKNGLHSNACNFLQIDNQNRLIIGQNTGIDLLNITDFYNNKISIQHLGKDDGLISLESNYNGSFKDKDGRILIGTANGLEIYNPKFDTKNSLEALTKINSIKLFFGQEDILKYSNNLDSIFQLPKNLKLPFNKNHITFDFIGVSLTAPEKVLYQYKLDGVDESWVPPTSKTEATYSSLPPGNYTFMLKAMNNDGIWNKEAVSFTFEILAPWYKTWWFYTLCTIALISSIIFYNYYKTKKLTADKQKLETQVTERTKELREEKEKVEFINKEVIEQKSVIEHKNLEITDSIKYAKNIQEALLPNLKEVNQLFENCFVLYMPKDIVSGDFYWFAKNGNTHFIAAVDCTGHGVPGAFMSIVGNTLLNEIVNEKNILVPGDILLELHKGVKIALNQNAMEFERRDGMDITLCAFNIETNEVQYSGANRPLWIYRKNKNYELEIIKSSKFPIGGIELEDKRIYENHIITVDKGDCLYLFTDGFADQFGGPKGKKYMISNLQKTILQNINLPMNKQKVELSNSFMNWKQDNEQVDDVLVIGIKI